MTSLLKKRYKLSLSYEGESFLGWQSQKNGRGVQDALEAALANLNTDPTRVFGAGRTDTGVHALGQVAHVDCIWSHGEERLKRALNSIVRPRSLAIHHIEEVAQTFHARFCALKRFYIYSIRDNGTPCPLLKNRAWVTPPLNTEHIYQASRALLGQHDFTTFRASHCQAQSPIKTLDACAVLRKGPSIFIGFCARSFLHRQIRSLVGSLKKVGDGTYAPYHIQRILDARDRSACGPIAPAHGLYLAHITYQTTHLSSDEMLNLVMKNTLMALAPLPPHDIFKTHF